MNVVFRDDGNGRRVLQEEPISIAAQAVTREEIECFDDDQIKIIFEMGKREGLAGAETCFDHTPYILPDGKEDSIPYTALTECNKANTDRRRCFQYAY